mgnify:CR=1 FL=1
MKLEHILRVLKIMGRTTDFLLGIFIGGGYSYRKMRRKVLYPTLPELSKTIQNKSSSSLREQKHKLHSLLYYLKKEGLIEKSQKSGKTYWRITALGRKKLEKLKNILHLPKRRYKKEKDDGLNIIIFDIPEKERYKRDWLRQSLGEMGFTMLQKSVWIGKNKFPEDFLKDLSSLNLVDFVHIFKVSKTGTIRDKKF